MKKDNNSTHNEKYYLGLNKQAEEEVLEISSTGYGLESVQKKDHEYSSEN
ncbi:hypothetical protein [Litchfieldia alkalitelluris]|nr:hypothetical protein [Litchfieldia alkalitelluris]